MAKDKLIKKEQAQVSNTAIPEHLQKYANLGSVGLENLQQEDVIMPRLAIAQAISPQVQKGDPARIEGLEVGQFFNTLTNEIYGENVRITPLFFFPSRVYFPPRGSTEGPICATNKLDDSGRLIDGRITPEGCDRCSHSQFLTTPRSDGSTNPDCTKFSNYICVVHKGNGLFEPVALSLKSKMLKPAKKFNSMMRVRNLPAFVQIFDLTTTPEKAAKGTFWQFVPNPAGDVSPQDIARVEALYESYAKRKVNIKVHDLDNLEDDDFVNEKGEERF